VVFVEKGRGGGGRVEGGGENERWGVIVKDE
jgi:hypothetical protein